MIAAERREALQEIVDNIRERYRPERIILFGSWARGVVDAVDADLLIVKETDEDPWTRLATVDRFVSHAVPVDVLVYTPAELRERIEMNDTFVKEVLEEGVVLHDTGA